MLLQPVLTGSDSISPDGSSYQAFCHNIEGWGPFTADRYDFTPCFMDVPVTVVSIFGILSGALTIWWLYATQSRLHTRKDWHYYSKLVSLQPLRGFT
jgi:ATP-binding cassette subfamily C (CFTR/MRP) protein 1